MRSKVADTSPTHNHPRAVYEIQVEGELDLSWEQWFSGLTASLKYTSGHPPTTTLTGAVADQAALRGMLCRLWDLNLTVVSVRRSEREEQGG
jgi:hypothetical protein